MDGLCVIPLGQYNNQSARKDVELAINSGSVVDGLPVLLLLQTGEDGSQSLMCRVFFRQSRMKQDRARAEQVVQYFESLGIPAESLCREDLCFPDP